MGEVYKARDTKLNRDVALKALPDVFAHDPERIARFRREAQVLASLNHPHIAQIYGIEEGRVGQEERVGHTESSRLFLILEFVDGPTLAELLAQGSEPVKIGRAHV